MTLQQTLQKVASAVAHSVRAFAPQAAGWLLESQPRALSREKVATAPIPNARQAWVSWVLGDDHYKRMSSVTVDLFAYVYGVFRPTREFFTQMETSPLQVKGCKFGPMNGTHGHWAVRFFRVPNPLWHGSSVYNGHFRGPVTLAPTAERLGVEPSLSVFNVAAVAQWVRAFAPHAED